MYAKVNLLDTDKYPELEPLWDDMPSYGYDYPGDGGYSRLIPTDFIFSVIHDMLQEYPSLDKTFAEELKEKLIYPFTILWNKSDVF